MANNNLNLRLNSTAEFVVPIIDVPTGLTIVSAIMVVKNSLDDPDSASLITKNITTTQSASGIIYNLTTGTGQPPTGSLGTAELHFDFTNTDATGANLLTTTFYLWAVKITFSNGANIVPPTACGRVSVLSAGITS